MSEYTAEGFKNVRFAEHRHGSKAVRWEMNYRVPWHTATGDRFSDEQMAENGWRPIVEVEDHEAIVALIGRQATRIRELEGERDTLEDLREENDRLERILQAPLSLKDLEVAWEQAEVPTEDNPIREGDALISSGHGGYLIRPAAAVEDGWTPFDSYRILSRAPQPEPWEGLADVLRAHTGEPDPDETARMLYERGVRVTGGDET